MTIYNITRPEDGETCTVDTAEEVPSAELFTFCDGWDGPLDWAQVSYIEGAAESLVAGEIADAKLDLASLGLELVGTHRELTPYDTGERATPIPWVSNPADFGTIDIDRDPDDFGRVDFDDDESSTVATIHLSKRDDGGYTVHIIPMHDDVHIEWHGETSARLTEEN